MAPICLSLLSVTTHVISSMNDRFFSICPKVFQRELTQGIIDVNNLIEYGNDLISGRESVTGASKLKLHLENTKSRWENIESHSAARQQALEDALEQQFKDDVNKILVWVQEKERQLDDVDHMIGITDLETFVQVNTKTNYMY